MGRKGFETADCLLYLAVSCKNKCAKTHAGAGVLQAIKIANQASYSRQGETLNPLKAINFIFGTNGSGKTTISRTVADPTSYPDCAVTWANGQPLECLVYNRDFVSRNFHEQMPGIFTLGEAEAGTIARIEAARAQITDHKGEVARSENTLGQREDGSGKRGELDRLRAEFETNCWVIKTAHDANFKDAFSGVRNSKEAFCTRLLKEVAENTATLMDIEQLKANAATVFSSDISRHPLIAAVDFSDLLAPETAAILAKKVIGKDDVDVAQLIRRLGNSDWVRGGLKYLEGASQCPFCQQDVAEDLRSRLDAYFDETYLQDMAAIEQLTNSYAAHGERVIGQLEQVLLTVGEHTDLEKLKAEVERLKAVIEVNKRQLASKRREPSLPISFETISDVSGNITVQCHEAIASITRHNALVDNLGTERKNLTAQIWKCLITQNGALIQKYTTEKSALDKAINGLTANIASKNAQLAVAESELRSLERNVTSVQPTVTAMNGHLSSMGFSGFKLRTAGDRGELYEIVRDTGESAATTLSEGESSFVSFLYFYHLLRGSNTASGVSSNRVVIFDDPVSSLDSDVLFVVGTLIKRILKEACDGTGQIKQVFVLTHNIYFHKEVSFDSKRGTTCRGHETFWTVRKIGGESRLTNYDHNPIKTSYELLWADVRSPGRSNATIQNTLRRIIESYFKMLGSIDTDQIVAMFDGPDQQTCASLFVWLHDGSHSVHDDLHNSVDQGVVDRYLDVFRRIFEKAGHPGHYKMMMGTQFVENDHTQRVAPDAEAA